MAADAEINSEAAAPITRGGGNGKSEYEAKQQQQEEEKGIELEDIMLSKLKLNPMAKEFFPSSYSSYSIDSHHQFRFPLHFFLPLDNTTTKFFFNDAFPNINNRRRRNSLNQSKRRLNGRAFRAQREDSIRRTVYVSDIDHNVTEERLAALFSGFGQVVDCRICGDPHSRLRFAFVEFADEFSARAALNLGGTLLGFSPVKVLPSKTAILPVNPSFLPSSEDEREMCARTVYCTNIDKKVSQADVKTFFETRCGEVSRLRLLGDHVHSTRIAFVEFVMLGPESTFSDAIENHLKRLRAESAIVALDCCGQVLGSQHIRVSPSKTPVRPRFPRPGMQ